MTRILVVEDDESLRRGLVFNLEREGYEVLEAPDCARARELGARAPRLALLDLGLPDGDGTDLLREWRAAGATFPVICLTARSSEAEVVMGFELGAVDYVRKPFGLAELLARVAVHLQRARPAEETATEGAPEATEELRLGDARVEWKSGLVRRGAGSQQLTPQEVELLRYLADRAGESVPRERLLQEIWGLSGPQVTRTLDNHVMRLRRKLETDPRRPRHLVTVHGVGYRLDPEG